MIISYMNSYDHFKYDFIWLMNIINEFLDTKVPDEDSKWRDGADVNTDSRPI